MATRTTLHTRTTPALVLTPGTQLALELLQIPTLELRDLVQQELLTNPLLDLEDEEVSAADDPPASNAGTEAPSPAPASQDEEPPLPDWADLLPERDEPVCDSGRQGSGPDGSLERRQRQGPTLAGHLLGQVRLSEKDPALISAAEFLIGCLDDRGYLCCLVDEAAADLGIPPDQAESALRLIQTLDPPGVGARDLRECLLLQLAASGREGGLAWRIVNGHLPDLVARRHVELSRRLGTPLRDVCAAVGEIRRLHPHPGRLVAADEVRYIFPDLIMERVGDGFEVYPNEQAMPRLRLSRWCREMLASGTEHTGAGEFARSRLRSARWLVRALDRRRSTMQRVAEAIAGEQKGFLEHGVSHLRPLTLQQVASKLGLHESTVARVVRNKYVQTPGGMFPLKFFFSSSLPTRSGGEASGRAVRERIRTIIEEEERGRPLSDHELARQLQRDGIRIARRTVAKYRESMKIEPARLRRRRVG